MASSDSGKKKAVNLGAMRERVTIQSTILAQALDHYGVPPQEIWSDIKTVAAFVQPLEGTELDTLGTVRSSMVYRVVIRHISWITGYHRLVWVGKILNIDAIIPDGVQRYITLACRESITPTG